MRRTAATVGAAVWFVLSPGVIGGLVPLALTGWRIDEVWPVVRVAGVVLVGAGIAALLHAFVQFVVKGLGTPAPVAAPHRLVVSGLYRHVRNPMYVAVLAAIVGQALLLGRFGLLWYAAAVALGCAALVHLYEEPALSRRFGAEYDDYRRAVRRWWPSLRPRRG